jgi:hypothetical protein
MILPGSALRYAHLCVSDGKKEGMRCTHPTYVRLWPIIAATSVTPPLKTALTDNRRVNEASDSVLNCSAEHAHREELRDTGFNVGHAVITSFSTISAYGME